MTSLWDRGWKVVVGAFSVALINIMPWTMEKEGKLETSRCFYQFLWTVMMEAVTGQNRLGERCHPTPTRWPREIRRQVGLPYKFEAFFFLLSLGELLLTAALHLLNSRQWIKSLVIASRVPSPSFSSKCSQEHAVWHSGGVMESSLKAQKAQFSGHVLDEVYESNIILTFLYKYLNVSP